MEKFEHPIQRRILLDEQSPIRTRLCTETRTIELKSELERYIYGCGRGLVVLSAALDKAAFSIELIKLSHSPLQSSIYSHVEQIEFAIENYFIRSAAVYDRALIFIGKLLDLGISDHSINHTLVVTNEHVNTYTLANPLKLLSKACREFATERNAIIHHRSYKNESFDKVFAIAKANDAMRENGSEIPFPADLVTALTQKVLKDHTTEFEEHLEKIKQNLIEILDTAESVYQIKRASYIASENQHLTVTRNSSDSTEHPKQGVE